MKNEILKFLKQDYLNNLDLIYALEHGAKIKYYNQAGIMLKFEDIYMLAFKDEKIAEQLGGNILNLLKKIILLRLKKHICLNELMLMYLWVRLLKSRLLDLLGVI